MSDTERERRAVALADQIEGHFNVGSRYIVIEPHEVPIVIAALRQQPTPSADPGTAGREAGAADGWRPWDTAPPDPDFYVDLPGDVEDGVGFATSVEDGRVLFLVLFECTAPGQASAIRWQPLPRALPLRPEGETETTEGGERG